MQPLSLQGWGKGARSVSGYHGERLRPAPAEANQNRGHPKESEVHRLLNCVGSLAAGWLGAKYPKHVLLGGLYILRAFVFTAYFIMPPTPASTPVFAAAMGMLWLSVAPLVSGVVAEMFGTRYMATLLGISFVMHQVGSSLGAFGGGLIFDLTGSYDGAWKIGVLIGFIAGVVQIVAGARPAAPTPPPSRASRRPNSQFAP